MTAGIGDMSDAQPPKAAKLMLVVFLPFGCGYYLSYLFRTVNAVISENLSRDLGIGPADLGLLTSIYLIAFALTQIPVGILLDRYGPRLVNSLMLLLAAAGAALFAFADDFLWLLVGRALIGVGVSAVLMGALKANAMWFPADRLPLLNNLIGACGAIGAVSATKPVEMLLHIATWRDVFAGLAVLTVLASALILIVVPEKKGVERSGESLKDQFAGFRLVLRDRFFWRVALVYAFGYTALAAYQTLWADPWLRDVARLSQAERANYLLAIQVGFLVGLVLFGGLADLLRRSRVKAVYVFGVGIALFLTVQTVLALGVTAMLGLTWFLFGAMFSALYLSYALLTANFPPALTARALTAMNFMVFVAAFGCQWGIGGVIEMFPRTASGGYPYEAHATGFAITIALQAVCYVFFLIPGRNKKARQDIQ